MKTFNKKPKNTIKKAMPVALAVMMGNMLPAQPVLAQATQPSAAEQTFLFYVVSAVLLIVCLLVAVVALYVLQVLRLFLLKESIKVEAEATESLWVRINKRFISGDLVPVEQEQTLVIDHSYDGIQELNNSMPPWLRYTFYGTIVFAAVYLINFFSLGLVQTSEQEYVAELAAAEKSIAAHQKLAAASIDENTAKFIEDAIALGQAKTIFDQNCKACHGGAGEGGVGPNLTDEYWIYGGDVKNIFKTIKYGVPQKGMIAWQQKLKPDEIQSIASYILTLQGTNPPNAKEPQGEKVANGTEKPEIKTVSMR